MLRELSAPTAVALGSLALVVLAKDLLGFSDLVVNRGLGGADIARIAAFELVPIVAHLAPFAALLGALVGIGRLREDHEVLALESCGLSARALALPVLAFACGIGALAGVGLVALAPRTERALASHLARAIAANPGAVLRPGVAAEFGDRRLEASEISPRGDRLRGVLLWMADVGETIFAREASLEPGEDGALRLTLHDGSALLSPRESPQLLQFTVLHATLEQDLVGALRGAVDPLAGESSASLRALGAAADPLAARDAKAELARRFALPAASLVFALLALPLALGGARFSRAQGAAAGIVATIAYYGLVQLGSGLVRSGSVAPTLAPWIPNAVGLALATILLVRLGRRGGGHERGGAARDESAPAAEPRPRTRALDRAVATRFLELALTTFGALLVGYLLIDVLERLQWFARHGASASEALRFYGARTPLLASRVLPMALLAASTLTVAVLARDGELVAMQSLGIAPLRGLAPVLVLALLAVPVYQLLNDVLVPRSNRRADELKEREIKHAAREARAIWYRDGDRLLRARSLDASAGSARDLTLYELDASGLPTSRTDALGARHVAGGIWELERPVRVLIGPQGLIPAAAPTLVDLGRAEPAESDPMHLGSLALARAIAGAESRGWDVTSLRVDLAARLAAPFACLLLPLLGLLYASKGPPFPRPALALLVCATIGVGYLLASALATALGYGKTLSPALAAVAPLALLAGVGALLALRHRA